MKSPALTGLLQFIETLIFTGIVTGAIALAPLMQGDTVNWNLAGSTFLAAFLSSVLRGLYVYAKNVPPPTPK